MREKEKREAEESDSVSVPRISRGNIEHKYSSLLLFFAFSVFVRRICTHMRIHMDIELDEKREHDIDQYFPFARRHEDNQLPQAVSSLLSSPHRLETQGANRRLKTTTTDSQFNYLAVDLRVTCLSVRRWANREIERRSTISILKRLASDQTRTRTLENDMRTN